jgi:energy-converting hydrogenase Eha subunit F
MATWIAHLRLAENLLEKIEGLDAAWFAIGSIAPDSGIPDENLYWIRGLDSIVWT